MYWWTTILHSFSNVKGNAWLLEYQTIFQSRKTDSVEIELLKENINQLNYGWKKEYFVKWDGIFVQYGAWIRISRSFSIWQGYFYPSGDIWSLYQDETMLWHIWMYVGLALGKKEGKGKRNEPRKPTFYVNFPEKSPEDFRTAFRLIITQRIPVAISLPQIISFY